MATGSKVERGVASMADDDSGCPGCRAASLSVIVPCHNEVSTVARVVTEFRTLVPHARLIVGDNASTDGTADAARQAGAEVRSVPYRGKGRTVRRLFENCTSDVVILVDGDATYDASLARSLVHEVVCNGYDLVNVAREPAADEAEDARSYRAGHQLGNRALTRLQRTLTGIELRDVLSGYKAMSRRFVSSLPVRSRRFQLEVEIASHAVALDFAYTEVAGRYQPRPSGSESKLSTWRDGMSILRTMLRLHRDLHPFAAFGALSMPWLAAALALVIPPTVQYFQTGKVLKFPSLIAGAAAFVVAMMLLTSGWILERTRGLRRDLLAVAASDLERRLRSTGQQ